LEKKAANGAGEGKMKWQQKNKQTSEEPKTEETPAQERDSTPQADPENDVS